MTDVTESFRAFLEKHASGARSTVDLLLASVDSATARRLRLCAIPHEFTSVLLTVIDPSLDVDAAMRVCSEFETLSIVIGGPRSYSLHDMARQELFRGWLSAAAGEFRAVSTRLVSYYTQFLDGAPTSERTALERNRMFHLLGCDIDAGFAEFEQLFRESRRVFRLSVCDTLLRFVREYEPIFTDAQATIVRYAEAKLDYDRGKYHDAVAGVQAALEQGASAPPELRVRMMNRLGMALDALKEWPEASGAYAAARSLAIERELWTQATRISINEAQVVLHQGDVVRAEELLSGVLNQVRAAQEPLLEAVIHASFGNLHRQNNDIERSLASYDQALRIISTTNDIVAAAQIEHNIGSVYAQVGEWDKSLAHYERSLALNSGANALGEGKTLLNMATAFLASEQAVRAADSALKAYERFEQVGAVRDMARSRRMLARVYNKQHRVNEAKATMDAAAKLFRVVGDPQAASELERERAAFGAPVVPWWAWCSLAALVLIAALLVLAVVIGLSQR